MPKFKIYFGRPKKQKFETIRVSGLCPGSQLRLGMDPRGSARSYDAFPRRSMFIKPTNQLKWFY